MPDRIEVVHALSGDRFHHIGRVVEVEQGATLPRRVVFEDLDGQRWTYTHPDYLIGITRGTEEQA